MGSSWRNNLACTPKHPCVSLGATSPTSYAISREPKYGACLSRHRTSLTVGAGLGVRKRSIFRVPMWW
eukprot:726040-Pyramimonas_sp.AAC.1